MSQEIILQLLKEYSFETLKTLKNLKTSNFAALPEVRGFYASNEIQVDEFQIQEYGNFYHVFICQGYRYDEYNHGLRITGSNRFEYFVKTRNTIQKEYKGFQNLKDSYPTLPEWIISELFKGDTSNELYKSMIEKIISVRNSDSHTSSEIMEVMDYFSLSPIRVKSKILSFLQRIGA